MKYYVLGSEDNKMLLEYREKYYKLLVLKLENLLKNIENNRGAELITNLILLREKSKKFILNGDNSVMINFLHSEYVDGKNSGLEKKEEVLERFLKQVGLLLRENLQELSMNAGPIISGTAIQLTTQDNNPYAALDAHPDHRSTGGIQGYGKKSEKEWLEVYNKTFSLLKKVDSGIWSELNMMISKIVPLGTAAHVHNSASYKECVGHLYMGYTLNTEVPELNNLEAVIHESSHNKLNIILHFDPVIINNKEERYYSPYRPDARHVYGVLLGLHAFVPVVYILMKTYIKKVLSLDNLWLEKITLYYIKNKITYKVLKKYGKFSPLGQEILDEMYEVMCLTDDLFKKLGISKEIIIRCKEKQIEHFSQVNKKYSYLEY